MENENEGTGTTPEVENNDGLGDAGKRALDAERKARKLAEKRAAELETKVKEAEDAEKTEVERLQGQVATLSKEVEAATAKADRFEVAAAKGLSLAQARRLVGSTKEELEEDADALRADLGLDKENEKPGTGKALPTEDLKSGASNEEDETVDGDELAESILKSRF